MLASHPQAHYSTVGRHGAVVALEGEFAGPEAAERLIAAVARAIEADRAALVIDLRRALVLDADVLQALFDVDRAGTRCGWRVAVVLPGGGPLRSLFQATALDQTLSLFATRAGATLWALAGARSVTAVPLAATG